MPISHTEGVALREIATRYSSYIYKPVFAKLQIRNLDTERMSSIPSAENTVKLWTVVEAAAFLNISCGTLYHWISQQRIPCIRFGSRCVRFDPQKTKEWVATFTEAQSPASAVRHRYAHRIGMEVGQVRITDAVKRWGSCGKGLNFSWRLIMAPLSVLDYVVIHELVHTIERNHSRNFWNKVTTMCPTYRSSMQWLKKNEHLLHI